MAYWVLGPAEDGPAASSREDRRVRKVIGHTVESIGYVIAAQGFVSFASQTFLGKDWGWLRNVVDLPSAAYLGILLGGLALVGLGVRTRKASGRQEAV